MKLLVYVTPWPENNLAIRGRSGFLSLWFRRFILNYHKGIEAAGEKLEVIILYPENDFLNPDTYPENYVSLMPITLNEISHIFADHTDYMGILNDTVPHQKKQIMLSYFAEKLINFKPDIIIGLTPCDFFSQIWKNTLCLVMEAGYFSRPPYPPTQYFDTARHLSKTFPVAHKEEILQVTNSDDVSNFLDPIFQHYRKRILDDLTFTRKTLDPEGTFRSILLLPLQFEDCPSFDHCCNFEDQTKLVEYVLNHLPSDTLLLITKHQFSIFDEKLIRKKYATANVKYISEIGNIKVHVSQRLLPFVDGVITVSSSIGMQAAIWDKFCICIGNSHVQAFADSNCINDLPKFLNQFTPSPNKKKLIAYLLTHYYVPFEFLWTKPNWCYQFFKHKLEHYRQTKNKNSLTFYPSLAANDELLDLYLNE